MNGLRLFIDNSNLFIEGQRTARNNFLYDDQMIPRLRINYGNLLDVVKKDRNLSEAVLVGSRPPQNDSLWKKLKKLQIEPIIFDRSPWTGKEKKVDSELITTIMECIYENPNPGTIALVAGDSDYIPPLNVCLKKEWKVELYFWGQASSELKSINEISFNNLDDNFKSITYLEPERE